MPSVLLSAFAFQAVEAERQARLADRALRLQEKGQGVVRELDGELRQAVLRVRAEVGAIAVDADLASDVAPVISRLVAREPFFNRFFLLGAQGRQAYPAGPATPSLRAWPEAQAAALGFVPGALLWQSPARLLPELEQEGGERAIRILSGLARDAAQPKVRAAALWDLAVLNQARADRPGIFSALEAYRTLAELPLGAIDARGRPSAAEARLRLALVHRLLRDRGAYVRRLTQLLEELEQHAYELPAETLEELADSVAGQLEYEGLGEEAAQRARLLTTRRQEAEGLLREVEAVHGEALRQLLADDRPDHDRARALFLQGADRGAPVISYAFLPGGTGRRGLVGLVLDRSAVEQVFREELQLVPGTQLVRSGEGDPVEVGPDLQELSLRPPLTWLHLRVNAPTEGAGGVEDALNLPRDTVYLWAIVLSIVGLAAGVFVTTRTVRREAKAAQLKSDWVANVTHELKTPLTSIQMFLETLQLGRVSDEAEAQECLDVMARESERLSRLIEQLLVFSRLDSRKPRLKLSFVEPRALVEEAIKLLGDQLNQSDPQALGIEVVSIQDLPQIGVDRFAIVQAILNLLQNAWKYAAGPGRRVRVVLTSRRRYVEIAVEDNGIGVPRRDRKRIFVKFERASNAEKGQIQGSGIGLTLANQIVKAHWGKITYAPLKPNGSRFSVLLPK